MIRTLSIFILFFMATQTSYAWEIELTEDELQQKINKRLPVEKKKLIFTVTIMAVDVVLTKGSDQIGLVADMEIRSPNLTSGKGRAELVAKPEYRQKDKQFFLQVPVVKHVEFENVPEKYEPVLKKVFQRLVTRRLGNTPIYKLDKNTPKHQLARSLLHSVEVKNGILVLEMKVF